MARMTRCESCEARIAVNSGTADARQRGMALNDCACDPISRPNVGRQPDQDIDPPAPRYASPSVDPGWKTDDDPWEQNAVRHLEDCR